MSRWLPGLVGLAAILLFIRGVVSDHHLAVLRHTADSLTVAGKRSDSLAAARMVQYVTTRDSLHSALLVAAHRAVETRARADTVYDSIRLNTPDTLCWAPLRLLRSTDSTALAAMDAARLTQVLRADLAEHALIFERDTVAVGLRLQRDSALVIAHDATKPRLTSRGLVVGVLLGVVGARLLHL